MIRQHYLKGWFTIDLVSLLPFDFFAMFSGPKARLALERLKILRMIRLLRLLKLARMLRASRMLKRWEAKISIPYSTISLIQARGCRTFTSVRWRARSQHTFLAPRSLRCC